MSILKQYYMKTWFYPLLGSLVFYGALIITNEAMHLSKEVFIQGASIGWLALLLLSSLPELLSIILPISSLIAGLIGTQSLSDNSEIVTSQGMGVGYKYWIQSWISFGILILTIGLLNSHFVTPWANSKQQLFRDSMSQTLKARLIKPGGQPWNPPSNPNMTIWSDFIGNTHIVEVRPKEVQHMIGQDINYVFSSNPDGSSNALVILKDLNGALYEQTNNSVILVNQKEQTLMFQIPPPKRIWKATPLRSLNSLALYNQQNDPAPILSKEDKVRSIELSRRWSLPFASVAFLLLGISIGIRHPRFKKSSGSLIALLAVLAYYFIHRYIEDLFLINDQVPSVVLNLTSFLIFLLAGYRFYRSLRPIIAKNKILKIDGMTSLFYRWVLSIYSRFDEYIQSGSDQISKSKQTLVGYLSASLLKNWLIVTMAILLIHLIINYTNLAGDISKNQHSVLLFFHYWVTSLPEFLTIVSPIIFIFSMALTLTEKSISREWVALKSSGLNMIDWFKFTYPALVFIVTTSLIFSLWLGPSTINYGDGLYNKILGRSQEQSQLTNTSWITLKTEISKPTILWFVSAQQGVRWGFPLSNYLESDPIIKFDEKTGQSTIFDWTGQRRENLSMWSIYFPSNALRKISSPNTTSTIDLFSWLIWSNDPERNYEIMNRLFGWLIGPLLLFALLSYALPDPKKGRSRALSTILFSSLLFFGIHSIIVGATQSGEIPVWWGLLAPMLLLLGIGLIRHVRIRT